MNRLNDVKVQILINAISKRPGLYDKNSKCFKDVGYKEKSWKEISQSVNANEKDCKVAWRSLRDQFVKSLKTPQNRKKYKHFKKLLFLKDSLDITGIPCYDETTLQENPIEMESAPAFIFEPCSSQTKSGASSDNETIPSPIHEITLPTSNKPSKREKDPVSPLFEGFLNELATQTLSREPDNIEIFFKSVANTVKSYNLSTSELAVLQCEILNFVTDRLEQIRTSK